VLDAAVREQHAGAPRQRKDTHTVSGRQLADPKRLGDVHHLVRLPNLDQAAAPERSPVQRIARRHPRGMRGRRAAAGIRVADLPREDRLAQFERPLADRHQPAAVVDAFHEGDYDFHLRALNQVGEEVEQVEIGFVAGRNGVVAAHTRMGGHRDNAETETAALGDHRHGARLERPESRTTAEADAGVVLQVEDAEAVGPYHPHVGLARRRGELRLQALAFLPRFAEPAGEHDRERNSGPPALFDGVRYALCGQRDERYIARLRHRQQIGVAGEAVDLAVFRIDRMDPARIAEIGEQLQRLAADARGVVRSADDREPARMQQARQVGAACCGRRGCHDHGHRITCPGTSAGAFP